MKILIVDDSSEKIAHVVGLIRSISVNLYVDTVLDVFGGLQKVKLEYYDLMIVDLCLPYRVGETPREDGGLKLIYEIERKIELKSPKYIIGLTQYAEQINKFSPIWNTLLYSSSETEWKSLLTRIINHILRVIDSKSSLSYSEELPTIFFEGESDCRLVHESFSLFKPEYLDKIRFRSEKGAGAKWVSNQIIAWSYSLQKNTVDQYIRAIGLLDDDLAGNDAKAEVNRIVKINSVYRETFKVISLSPSYARSLIPLYQKGINIPVAIEEMFTPKYWKIASENNWLEKRTDADSLLSDPKNWNKFNQSLSEYIFSLGLSEDDFLYLSRFKKESKEDFCKLILNLPIDQKLEALQPFEQLVNNLVDYLFEY